MDEERDHLDAAAAGCWVGCLGCGCLLAVLTVVAVAGLVWWMLK